MSSIDRGEILTAAELEKMPKVQETPDYQKRHLAQGLPHGQQALVVTDSDEHDEDGHMIEDAATRASQVEKRMRKQFSLKQYIAPPARYGPKTAETTLIGWGSTYGPLKEAVDMLHKENVDVNLVHFMEIWPFDREAALDAIDGPSSTTWWRITTPASLPT